MALLLLLLLVLLLVLVLVLILIKSPSHLAIPDHHISDTRPLIWRTRPPVSPDILNTPPHFAIHAPSCGISGSSYILSCPFVCIFAKDRLDYPISSETGHLSWRFRFMIYRKLPWRFRFIIYQNHARFRSIIYLNHALSFGDSGAAYILNTPPHSAIPLQHAS